MSTPSSPAPLKSYTFAFALVTTLFFLWGFCHAMLDVLNKHFQNELHLSLGQSGFIQSASYLAYFLMAVPAAMVARRFGYKGGVLAGLGMVVIGALLFIPCALVFKSYLPFLLALFILFSGLTFLETTANPYVTVLGPPETASSRLVLAQSFNGVGWVIGPAVGGLLIFNAAGPSAPGAESDLSSLVAPYGLLAAVVFVVALVFFFVKLPEISGEVDAHGVPVDDAAGASGADRPLWTQLHFVGGVLAQFCYVGAQCAIFAFAINYFADNLKNVGASSVAAGIVSMLNGIIGFFGGDTNTILSPTNGLTDKGAAYFLSFSFALFTLGRFTGAAILRVVSPPLLLAIYAAVNIALMLFIMQNKPDASFIALILSFFFMSIMFPTIFSISLHKLGRHTKTGASWLVMSIIGGALTPPLMGRMVSVEPARLLDTTLSADALAKLQATYSHDIGLSFIVPLLLFVYLVIYGLAYPKLAARDA